MAKDILLLETVGPSIADTRYGEEHVLGLGSFRHLGDLTSDTAVGRMVFEIAMSIEDAGIWSRAETLTHIEGVVRGHEDIGAFPTPVVGKLALGVS